MSLMLRWKSWWRRQSLARQFVIAGSLVLLAGMLAIGTWVTRKIETQVTRNTAATSALYLDGLFAPPLQELAEHDRMAAATEAEFRRHLASVLLSDRFFAVKVWKPGGLIAYASRPSEIGRRYPETAELKRAWDGVVSGKFNRLTEPDDAAERASGLPLLEIFTPIRDNRTGRVVAVIEAYEKADDLKHTLWISQLESWLVVAAVTVMMLSLLAGIVIRGSRTIDRQRGALQRRVAELSRLLEQNEQLRLRVQQAAQRTAEINERFLRRIGADLHDGPAQLLALATLRLDGLGPTPQRPVVNGQDDLEVVRSSLTEAMGEIRDISRGLILPELDALTPAEALRHAALAHERRTCTSVALDLDQMPDVLPRFMKICLYRVVQEGLTNAYRHADGVGQAVGARFDGRRLEVTVADRGPGWSGSGGSQSGNGLGLTGMVERVRTLGGELKIESAPGEGTKVRVSFVVEDHVHEDR